VRVSWVVFPELQGDTLMQVIAVKAGHRGARVQRIAGRHFGRPDPRGRAPQRRLITTLSEACIRQDAQNSSSRASEDDPHP
jgi:hypothetical protein